LDCEEIDRRFGKILADPNGQKRRNFRIFPRPQEQPVGLRGNRNAMMTLFQLRHAVVHNAGVLTRSDALKLSRLTKCDVSAPRIVWPDKRDIRCVKLFLDDLTKKIGQEVGSTLGQCLIEHHPSGSCTLEAHKTAKQLANAFQVPITIGGHTAQPD
jgi:hypothetical protein